MWKTSCHTSRIIVEVQGDVKKGGSYEENMVIEFDKMKNYAGKQLNN